MKHKSLVSILPQNALKTPDCGKSLLRNARENGMNEKVGSIRDILKFCLFLFAVSFSIFVAVILVGSFASFQRDTILEFLRSDYYSLLSGAIGLVAIVGYLSRFCRRRKIGFSRRFYLQSRVSIISISNLVYALILLAICLVYDRLLSTFGMTSDVPLPQSVIFSTISLVAGINTVLLGPIREEFVFRGFMFPILEAKLGTRWGIIVTSLVFSFPHFAGFPQDGLHPAVIILMSYFFAAGILFNVILIREKNLLSSILFHSFVNIIVFIFY